MTDILALLQCLRPDLDKTTTKQLSRIIPAMIAMTGRVTMRGLSRWTKAGGGSYRTIQRFFMTTIPWAQMFWLFFRHHLFQSEATYILAGDECVVTKAGKKTYGLDYFFSSIYSRVVPGLAFFALSLIDVQQRRSYPIMIEQVIRTQTEKETRKKKTVPTPKRRRGRPRGSKNKNKSEVLLCPELVRIQEMVKKFRGRLSASLTIKYLVMDGKFGHNNALQMVQQQRLHLLSKLRCDSELYFGDDTPYPGQGAPKKYGDKVAYTRLPESALKATCIEKGIQTRIYQATLLHKKFAQPLNVVIIHKTNLKTKATAYVVLFCSDLALPFDQLIDYYRLRFQIEFNFRDAKQYWGLEDFMNVHPTAVTNAANLSLFMVNVSHHLLRDFRKQDPTVNVLDMKAYYRGHHYVVETLKCLPEKPEPFLMSRIFDKVSRLGRIHPPLLAIPPS